MDKSIIAKLILEHLYVNRDNKMQYFYSNIIPERFIDFVKTKGVDIHFQNDERVFRETFWDLVSKGLVVPGDKGGARLPQVSITKYGIECYETGKILPYDPEGFLNSLNEKVSDLDEIIKMYFEEAVACYSNMNYLASAVMIGGALEKMILYLIDERFIKLLNDGKQETEIKKIIKIDLIKKKFDKFLDFIKRNKIDERLNKASKEKLFGFLPGVVHLIRTTRNEVGHPTGREINRDEAEGNILLAKQGVIFCYQLLDELENIETNK